ncbi:hypothetical protein Ahy_A01g004442 [Arachis hypogaea]|uniref:Uncharacterized protein n=1 Tax=Arachis hypogaea TaxID=3818 RepID=A0A445EW42_ARAHY|nr:hypothetical protein Ahy_A01g004442 [Arachis hypogaea]
MRNYITREVRNISEQDDAKEFGKYLLRIKEKNKNFFFELNLEVQSSFRFFCGCESPRSVDTSRMRANEK